MEVFYGVVLTIKGKKIVANDIRPSVFGSVPQSVFLVAASKTDATLKTEYIIIKPMGKKKAPSVFLGIGFSHRFLATRHRF